MRTGGRSAGPDQVRRCDLHPDVARLRRVIEPGEIPIDQRVELSSRRADAGFHGLAYVDKKPGRPSPPRRNGPPGAPRPITTAVIVDRYCLGDTSMWGNPARTRSLRPLATGQAMGLLLLGMGTGFRRAGGALQAYPRIGLSLGWDTEERPLADERRPSLARRAPYERALYRGLRLFASARRRAERKPRARAMPRKIMPSTITEILSRRQWGGPAAALAP